MKILTIIAGLALCAGAIQNTTAAVVISNFEAPTYTAGSSYNGVDGWIPALGSPTANIVTPDANSGYTFVLAGSQSAMVPPFNDPGSVKKPFSSAGATAADMYELSWLQGSPDALGVGSEHGLLVITNVGGNTPVGLYAKNLTGNSTTTDSTISFFSGVNTINSSVSYLSGGGGAPTINNIYQFTLRFNWTTNEVSAFAENVTLGSPADFIGTLAIDTMVLPNAATMAADFGVVPWGIGGIFGIDNITITPIPEPTTVGLITLGLLGFALLRRRQQRA